MRLIYVAILGGFLFSVVAGCGRSNRVEMPKNPAPMPKNPPVSAPKPADAKSSASQKQLSLPPAAGQTQRKK